MEDENVIKDSNVMCFSEVNLSDWHENSHYTEPLPDSLARGQVLFRVARFAFTSNNISYMVAGKLLDYWGFFPASKDGLGRIPVMGIGEVVLSEHPAAQKGERFFGFFPNASHLIIEAQDHPEGLVDAAPHRSAHAPIYRQYARCSTDAFYTRETEDLMLLLRGLFLTSFLVEDFVDNGVDAERLIISSASSKTSIALAFQAAQRGKLEVVGLTSKRNLEFVEGLGLYDEVIEYSDLETLAVGRPAVFVDMAGNADVNLRLHTHLGDSLRYHCSVGATHWQDREGETVLPGVAPVFFFAPGQIGKRAKDWGPEGLQKRMVEGWQRFRDGASDWLTVCHHFGMDDAANGQAEVRTGVASPDHGYILSLWEDPS